MSAGHWIVLYDRACGLCRWLLAVLLRWDRRSVLAPMALQRPEAATLLADLTPEKRMASWHLISPTGERTSGGAALAQVLALLPGGAPGARVLARYPAAAERGYALVADHRTGIGRLVPAGAKRRAGARVEERERGLTH